MRIKQILNDKVNCFDFYFDLSKEDYLQEILTIFKLKEVYLCFYGVDNNFNLSSLSKFCEVSLFQDISTNKRVKDVAIKICVSEITKVFSFIHDDFDELDVWDCYSDWGSFIIAQTKFPIFTFKRNQQVQHEGFYLEFCPYKDDEVRIISYLSFNDSAKITKDNLKDILSK